MDAHSPHAPEPPDAAGRPHPASPPSDGANYEESPRWAELPSWEDTEAPLDEADYAAQQARERAHRRSLAAEQLGDEALARFAFAERS